MSARIAGTPTTAVARRRARLPAMLTARSDGDPGDLRGRALQRRRDGRRVTLRLRRRDVPEAPLALLVARDGGVELRRAEVGPEHVGEVELRVREPIEEEVRDAPLAASADDQVRIADGEARHQAMERVRR